MRNQRCFGIRDDLVIVVTFLNVVILAPRDESVDLERSSDTST